MSYLDRKHKKNIRKIKRYWKGLEKLSKFALKFGINDIFQDNEAKTLQQLIFLNFQNLEGREGNDATDENGVEWEMKSINTLSTATGFSTNHHLNHDILTKYREVPWSFSFYEGIHLKEIYVMSQSVLEPIFAIWESKLNDGKKDLNNPKINMNFVKKNGVLIYSVSEGFLSSPLNHV